MFVLSFSGLSILDSAPARAHIQLDAPAARTTSQKDGPCGAAGSTRGETVTVFAPGETITVRWRETINHPSHYRIAFDADGDDDFADPLDFMDFSGNSTVLLDAIEDRNGGEYSAEITLPAVTCEACTLQVVQVMYDKPPYGDGNDLYYQCADLALRGDTPPPADVGVIDPADVSVLAPGDVGVLAPADAAPADQMDAATPDAPLSAPEKLDAGVGSDGGLDDGAGDDDGSCTTGPGRGGPPVAWLLPVAAAWLVRRRRSPLPG